MGDSSKNLSYQQIQENSLFLMYELGLQEINSQKKDFQAKNKIIKTKSSKIFDC